MTRLRDESGFTLIELMISAALSLIIFSATLTVLTSLIHQRSRVVKQNEVEQQARQSVDRLARKLRNLASPADIITAATSTQPKSVDRNLPDDLVFKDVGDVRPGGSANSANVRRLRYCLQTAGTVPGAGFSASPARGVLWMQTQTWTTPLPPAMPPTTDCPGSGWPAQAVVADHLVNAVQAPPRSVFRYSGDAGLVTATTPAAREQISRVEATATVDEDTTRSPGETTLTTSVLLRNQNRAPIARFTHTLLNPVTCSVQLNGSASEDPESKALEYEWWLDGVKLAEEGVVVQTSVPVGSHVYELRVYDPAQLMGTYTETHACPT